MVDLARELAEIIDIVESGEVGLDGGRLDIARGRVDGLLIAFAELVDLLDARVTHGRYFLGLTELANRIA